MLSVKFTRERALAEEPKILEDSRSIKMEEGGNQLFPMKFQLYLKVFCLGILQLKISFIQQMMRWTSFQMM